MADAAPQTMADAAPPPIWDPQSSPILRRELALYGEYCQCTARVHARAALLHAALDRVIVFDVRFRWWGLGNNLGRWLTLIRLGLASGRATFLWFSREGDSRGPGAAFRAR